MIRPLVLALGLLVVIPSFALAHGGNSKDYVSEVRAIVPDSIPITAEVKGRDDRIRIENQGTKELLIEGYDSNGFDTYLKIDPSGAYVNIKNRAYFENKGRYGAPTPEDVKAGSKPEFKVAQRVPFYTFHDHRIHWMAKSTPPSVDPNKAGRQKVFDWKIGIRYDGEPGTIEGTLYYVGGKSEKSSILIWGGTGLAVLLLVGFFLWDRRKRRRKAAPLPEVDGGVSGAEPS